MPCPDWRQLSFHFSLVVTLKTSKKNMKHLKLRLIDISRAHVYGQAQRLQYQLDPGLCFCWRLASFAIWPWQIECQDWPFWMQFGGQWRMWGGRWSTSCRCIGLGQGTAPRTRAKTITPFTMRLRLEAKNELCLNARNMPSCAFMQPRCFSSTVIISKKNAKNWKWQEFSSHFGKVCEQMPAPQSMAGSGQPSWELGEPTPKQPARSSPGGGGASDAGAVGGSNSVGGAEMDDLRICDRYFMILCYFIRIILGNIPILTKSFKIFKEICWFPLWGLYTNHESTWKIMKTYLVSQTNLGWLCLIVSWVLSPL